jgi:hypothetical protein
VTARNKKGSDVDFDLELTDDQWKTYSMSRRSGSLMVKLDEKNLTSALLGPVPSTKTTSGSDYATAVQGKMVPAYGEVKNEDGGRIK